MTWIRVMQKTRVLSTQNSCELINLAEKPGPPHHDFDAVRGCEDSPLAPQ